MCSYFTASFFSFLEVVSKVYDCSMVVLHGIFKVNSYKLIVCLFVCFVLANRFLNLLNVCVIFLFSHVGIILLLHKTS